MLQVVWLGEEGVPDELLSSDEVEVLPTSTDDVSEAVRDSDRPVVVLHEMSLSEAGSVISEARGVDAAVPCILYAAERPEDTDAAVPVDAVFDYVPSEGGGAVLLEAITSASRNMSHAPYPVPEDEEGRVREVEVYKSMDPLDELDRLTEIAYRHFDVDSTYVGLIDRSSQRAISCYGIDSLEIDREDTACTYNILDSDTMVVEDVSEDPRFEANETMRDFGLRFYAGHPIEAESGERIGTFCLLDTEPREFTEDDEEMLRLIAEEAESKLRRMRKEAERAKAGGG